MAYNKRYNPDALPAHVEPEQAAAMLSSSGRPQQYQQSQQQAPSSDRYNRPAPPPTSSGYNQHQTSGRYDSRPSHQQSQSYNSSYNSGPPPLQSSGSRYGSGGPPGGYGNNPGSPIPQNYGFHNQNSRPPPPTSHGRPPLQDRPPATPAPPKDANDREALWPLFRAVDKDGTGQLTETELRAALVNGDWTRFDAHTVRMMIRMFDTDRNGTISFDEFCGLWAFLAAWRNLFDRFDVDRSGSISYNEFSEALVAFGYRLSPSFVQLLYRTYDRGGNNAMSFDLFVQACISLKRMTDVFKKYDDDRDGYITLSFEEFLTEILQQMV